MESSIEPELSPSVAAASILGGEQLVVRIEVLELGDSVLTPLMFIK